MEEQQGLRQKKVGRLLQNTLNEYFRAHAADFASAMITVTATWVAKDLKMTRIYVSIFGLSVDKNAILKQIHQENKTIRGFVGKELGKQLQFIPELFFKSDDSQEDMAQIERLLQQ